MTRKSVAVLLAAQLVFATAACARSIFLRSATLNPTSKTDSVPLAKRPARAAYYIVQFDEPVTEEHKSKIRGVGAVILDYIPQDAFVVRIPPGKIEQVRNLGCVSYLGRLQPDFRADPALMRTRGPRSDVLIQLFPGESQSDVEAYLRGRGGRMVEASPSGRFIRIDLPRSAVDGLLRLEGVAWAEEWQQPRTTNNVAAQITGVETTRARTGIYGRGQVLAIADTGLDTGNLGTIHADFAGRIISAYGLKRPGVWSDLVGHGTHTTGSAVGSGVLSGSSPGSHSYDGSFAGFAPEASIVFQSIGDNSPYTVYPPLDLSELFQPAYNDGARVHSNSWGTPAQGKYTVYAQQVDDFLWSHKDFIAVFPTGNDGRDASPRDGVTDSGSVYTPGTAKNCITVGATESVRTTGYITTYGQAWGADFPWPPIYADNISDNAGGMAAWSGRGPCADNRIKPDVCAPGTNIISCRSHTAMNSGWQIYNQDYIYWGGTSMSTPMVAGAAVLVRQYYVGNHGVQPSAALVKATLLNGAVDMFPGQYGGGTTREIRTVRPDIAQGWGRLDISRCIEPAAPMVVDFVDETSGLTTGQSRQYQFSVLNSSVPFSATLVWTDPPGTPLAATVLVNDLNLRVLEPNGFTQHKGNGGAGYDQLNNAETVDIASPPAGIYTITVTAQNVPVGPQPFALVVSGALPGGYVAGRARTASGRPIAGAEVTVAAQGGGTRSTVTDGNGSFTVHVQAGTYTVTSSKTGWSFAPTQRVVEVQDVGVTGVDFTGSAPAGAVSGTVTKAIGGLTNYVVESPHPYYDNCNLTYTIAAEPEAARIRVHFSDMEVQDYYDFIYVENEDGSESQAYTGSDSDLWSDWVTGNVARIRLEADASENGWGFYIDGYETDLQTLGGQSGVTVTAGPYSESAVTGAGGTYTIPGLEPVAYNLTPSRNHWRFSPATMSVNVPPGSTLTGADFLAFPPASVSGHVLTGTVHTMPYSASSDHPYLDDTYETWDLSYTGPEPCSRIRVHFSRLETEQDYDFVFIQNSAFEIVDAFTGSYPSGGWSSWIPGNELHIVLKSDYGYGSSNTYWGFAADRYQIAGNERPVANATAKLQPSGATALSGTDGVFTFAEVDAGKQYVATVTKRFWEFSPGAADINCVSGLTTTVPEQFGILGVIPSIRDAKSLPDGDDVVLVEAVVTAAGGQFVDFLYVEDADRVSGIRVRKTAHGLSTGQKVSISGTLQTNSDGERYIDASVLTPAGIGSLDPLGMTNSRLGGGDWRYDPETGAGQKGITGNGYANNIGLLTRVWGKVTMTGQGFFYLDDGSGVSDGGPALGIYVSVGDLAVPAPGSYVGVTGISSCRRYLGAMANALLPRTQNDIVVLRSP